MQNYKSVNANSINGSTPLRSRRDVERLFLNAVVIGNTVTARSCLEKGVNPNVFSADGLSPLHIAAEKDDLHMGKLLMGSKNIQLNQQMSNGDTALIHATRFRNKSFVKLLLNIKTDGIETDSTTISSKPSTVERISKSSMAERKFAKLWMQKGANPNCKNNVEKTALHVAAILGQHEIVKDLINAGAEINVADTFGNTPLTYCVLEHPDVILARYLLSKGANPNFWTCRPNALFLETALNCTSPILLEMIELLLDYGVDIDIVNPITQFTALHMVGISGYTPLAELLLQRNANLYAKDCLNRTPYDIAVMHDHRELITFYKKWMKDQKLKEIEKEKRGVSKKKLTFAE